ncbi:MAG: hypothetical protein ACR2H4_04695 [Pyrinomonadaceae bacterium]
MTRPLFLTLPLFFVFVAAVVIVPGLSQQEKPRSHAPKVFDESRFPIAEYSAEEPTDAAERAQRLARGKKYDKSEWRVNANAVSDSMVRVDFVDRDLPALPFEQSSAVIVGQVTNAHAYLSNDKSGIYSVFTIQVNEILKNSSKNPLIIGTALEVERDGGRVRFPNGKLHLYKIAEQDMPKTGLRYVLFLTGDESNFQILTGYELRDSKVYPLDDLPKLRSFENADELTFLSEIRTKKL